jgi:hypothetical protein
MNRWIAFGLTATIATLTGCGGGGLVPASGTVTYQSKPIADANVIFTPKGEGRAATGITDASGKFVLGTEKTGDGAMPGEYRVSVTPNLPPPAEGDYSAPPPPPFPAKYTTAGSSDLTATVKKGDPNQFTLEMK